MKSKNTDWLPLAGLFLAMMLWGSSFIALKLAFRSYDPMVVIFGRMAIASLGFLLLLPRFKVVAYRKGDWKPLLLLAVFEPCLYFIFEAWALCETTASQAGMIVAMLPLLVALAAWLFLQEHISRSTLFGFLLAIGGAIWLSAGASSSEHAPNPALGNFLEFLAMIFAAGYTIMVKKLSPRYSATFITAVQVFVGSVFFFPLMFLPPTQLPVRFDPLGAAAVLYLGALVTVGAYGLYNYGVSRIPASQASAFTNLIPVFAVFLGWLILGESFNPGQYLAGVLVFAGVLISQDPHRSEINGSAKNGWRSRLSPRLSRHRPD